MTATGLDLVTIAIGSLFVAVAIVAIAAALSSRPTINSSAAWFGVFCGLYGTRLLTDSRLFRVVIGLPNREFQYVDAVVTHVILLPVTLFIGSLFGTTTLLRRTSQLLAVYALVAVTTIVVTRRPYAAMPLNAPALALTIAAWFFHLGSRSRRAHWPLEIRVLAVAGALLALTGMFETVSGGLFGDVDAEPLVMLLFATTLGWVVLRRTRQQELSLAAVDRELDLARTIQQSLLPREMPGVPGLRLGSAYLPMSAVAGDFYEILPLAGGRVMVLVADVSGHGVPAALIASMMKVAVAAEADRYGEPGDILSGVNRAITGKFEQAYVTACCVVVDPRSFMLRYALAGHPPPLLRRAIGSIERLDRGGTILTLMPGVAYETSAVGFRSGDRLIIYTDGLTEAARAKDAEFFGDEELARVLASAPASDSLLNVVVAAHRRWIGDGTPLSDDISIVVVEAL